MKYLIVTYVRKANGEVDEQLEVANKISKANLRMANIILDFSLQKVVRCVVDREKIDTDWNRIREYFATHYSAITERIERENTLIHG